MKLSHKQKIIITTAIAALGYFIDIFDAVLFTMLRTKSLSSLGIDPDAILSSGIHLINTQLSGMLIGGLTFGIIADKFGRKKLLIGSILIYSSATLLNAYVTNLPWYFVCRFFAGLGLGAEGGLALTLVSELVSKKSRGLLPALVATCGTAGAAVASIVGQFLTWQMAYIVGGLMGLFLMLFRVGAIESSIYLSTAENKAVKRGIVILKRNVAR